MMLLLDGSGMGVQQKTRLPQRRGERRETQYVVVDTSSFPAFSASLRLIDDYLIA
jgi:hypothetical protein